MGKGSILTKRVDSKGRITLGGAFANRIVLVERRDDEIVLRLARVIPEREAWLYENPEALSRVRAGLDEARRRKFAESPDLGAAAKVAGKIRDD